jgi:hypothetical protein
MTLSERNFFFKTGIAFCAVFTLLILAASFLVVPVYPTMAENDRRPSDFFQVFLSGFLNANYLAVHASMIMAVLFSLIGISLIHYFFLQTSAPEILFIAFFTISFSFEAIRLIIPLRLIFDISTFYILLASRILLFARYFSIFSLFAASICAAGLEIQKTRNIILIVIIATLVITFGVPIDILSWDTGLNMITGYSLMLNVIELVTFIIIVINFFVAANVCGSKEYNFIGMGAAFALIGRYLLLKADNLACPLPGILLLSIGTWFICSRLHKIHLWL